MVKEVSCKDSERAIKNFYQTGNSLKLEVWVEHTLGRQDCCERCLVHRHKLVRGLLKPGRGAVRGFPKQPLLEIEESDTGE